MRRLKALPILLVLFLYLSGLPTWAREPIWAKHAVSVQTSCDPSNPTRIPSPDRASLVEVSCGPADSLGERKVFLTITGPSVETRDVELPEGAAELLWAPDSKRFLINGSESVYSGFFVRAYELRSDHIEGRDFTAAAQRDMVATFPPCKAANRSEEDCKRIERDPQFNMSGLAWTRGGSAVVVIAEVPCSSSYGGIMCLVQGYELEVSTGRVLRRMASRELRKNWQSAMAWKMRIPEPPIYGSPWVGK